MLVIGKVCPIVLREKDNAIEILAFTHPTLYRQLVKGTIETNEEPEIAAVRELAEESGLTATNSPLYLGQSETLPDGNHWYFYLCEVEQQIPDQWSFYTEDDGGLWFQFFWHNLETPLDESWHHLFHEVMSFIRPLILAHYK